MKFILNFIEKTDIVILDIRIEQGPFIKEE